MNVTPTLPPPLGIAHLTTNDVEPIAFVEMAARVGYATMGLRLYPAFPGAPFYEIPVASALMRSMRAPLANTGLSVYDIELATIEAAFEIERLKPALNSAAELGTTRITVCEDADRPRLAAARADICDLAAEFGMASILRSCLGGRREPFTTPWLWSGTPDAPIAALWSMPCTLARSGGDSVDLHALPRQAICSAQLCDAPAGQPATTDCIIQEARAGRMLPGDGDSTFHRMLAEPPDHTALSVEVPNGGIRPSSLRAACTEPRSPPCQPSGWQGMPDRYYQNAKRADLSI